MVNLNALSKRQRVLLKLAVRNGIICVNGLVNFQAVTILRRRGLVEVDNTRAGLTYWQPTDAGRVAVNGIGRR